MRRAQSEKVYTLTKKVIAILTSTVRFGIALVLGMAIAYLLYSFFREQIQHVYRWATFDRIDFIGKNFFLFANHFYYISFAITLTIFAQVNKNNSAKQIIKNVILLILIFAVSVIGISAINANAEIAACTTCGDGIRILHWNAVNYELILGVSALLSVLAIKIPAFRNR